MTKNVNPLYPPENADVSAANPSLDPQETTAPRTNGLSHRSFLTSGMQPAIDYSEQIYTAIDERDDKNRLATFRGCRTDAWFVRHRVTGQIRIISNRCNLRWCPLCIKTKRFVMLQSLIPWVKSAKKPKFITLTLRSSDADLSFQIDSLYGFFRNLRRRPFWNKRVSGGVWFFQITRNEKTGRWHPHLHVLADGRYIPHADLSRIWDDITHGSSVVDIRAVKSAKKVAEYVARYATSPCSLDKLPQNAAIEVVDSLHGRRVCGTFGTAKGIQLVPKKCPDAEDWEIIAGFSEVMMKRHSNSYFHEIYDAFTHERRCYSRPPDPRPAEQWTIREWLKEEPLTFEQLVFEWSNY